MSQISSYAAVTPLAADYLLGNKASTVSTQTFTMSALQLYMVAGAPDSTNISTSITLSLTSTNRVLCSSAAVTTTVPDGANVGDLCRVIMDKACTKINTLSTASLIDNLGVRKMWASENATLRWSGSTWEKVFGRAIPMMAGLTLIADTASSINADETAILLDAVLFDNTGLMANAGANKITLQRTSFYQVYGQTALSLSTSTASLAYGAVKQAGVSILAGPNTAVGNTASAAYITMPSSGCINGTAGQDMTMIYYQNSGQTSPTVLGTSSATFMRIIESPNW